MTFAAAKKLLGQRRQNKKECVMHTHDDPIPPPTSTALTIADIANEYFCGPPPLLVGEDYAAYSALLERVWNAIRPKTIFEKIWTHEFVQIHWELVRLQRVRVGSIEFEKVFALAKVVDTLQPEDTIYPHNPIQRALGWIKNNEGHKQAIENLLAEAGLTMNHVAAQSVEMQLAQLASMDKLIESLESRRRDRLREIERSQAAFADRLRRATSEAVAEDADFREI